MVEMRAQRGAGPAAPGAAGVSLGAAAEFLKRQRALAASRADNRPDGDRPKLKVVGEGVRVRGGTTGD